MSQSVNQSAKPMQFVRAGNDAGPLVVCIHGILGHPENFDAFVESWGRDHSLLIPHLLEGDPLKIGYSESSPGPAEFNYQISKQFRYEVAAERIAETISQEFPGVPLFLVGVSFGGKICFDLAARLGDAVTGICATDVGFGPLCEDSDLFRICIGKIPELNLNQNWESLRKEIALCVPDRMMRVLIQNHLEYIDGPNQASWKASSRGFYDLFRGNKLEQQWHLTDQVKCPILIFKAARNSAISESDVLRMAEHENIEIFEVPDSNHFLHIHCADIFREKTLKAISENHRSKGV
jgi:pimeloyl-ACP methyl ester carboxylesterase